MAEESTTDKRSSLLKLVEDRALLKKEQDEEKKKQQVNLVPYIPKDCISNILVRLPLESLQRLRFVCKSWYKIITSPTFVDAHLRRAENVLIFLQPFHKGFFRFYSETSNLLEKGSTFSVEARLRRLQYADPLQQHLLDPLLNPISKFYIKFMVIKDGKSEIGGYNATCLGKIRATCNGLILLGNTMNKGGLIVMNPVTREVSPLPLGTVYPPHEESYGLAFNTCTGEYKVVHLFRDELSFIGCETLQIGQRSWRDVDGPSFGLLSWFGYDPIFAIEALHWIPHIDHNEYLISMTIDDEKFHKILLPKTSRSSDRIMEMAEILCFVTHNEEINQIEVWNLRKLCEEDWTKVHTIRTGCIKDMVPLYCTRLKSEFYFMDKDGSLFAYDFHGQVMRKVELKKGDFPVHGCYFSHVNSLISWRMYENGQGVAE